MIALPRPEPEPLWLPEDPCKLHTKPFPGYLRRLWCVVLAKCLLGLALHGPRRWRPWAGRKLLAVACEALGWADPPEPQQ